MTEKKTISSMTGFGRGTAAGGGLEITVELKSVNNRFLDAVVRLPSGYARFEPELQKLLRSAVRRGRVEMSLSRTDTRAVSYDLLFNEPLFEQYVTLLREKLTKLSLPEATVLPNAIAGMLAKREVVDFVSKEGEVDDEWQTIKAAFEQALTNLLQMRAAEGQELANEINRLMSLLEQTIETIKTKVAEAPADFSERLRQRLERVQPKIEVDPDRLAQEVALLAERVDVTEEIARLQSHMLQFKSVMGSGEGGRKLEFLLQEFGREINTIGSKAQNSEVTAEVIEAKSTLEKLREQIQNVE